MLAQLHNVIGDHVSAAAHAEKAIALEDAIGRLWTLSAMNELAVSLSGRERFDEASEMVEDIINERAALAGDTVPLLPYLLSASRNHRAAGEPDKALAYGKRAFDVAGEIRPSDAWKAAEVRGEYGLALLAAGDATEAEPLITAARARLAEVFGADDPRVRALAGLGPPGL